MIAPRTQRWLRFAGTVLFVAFLTGLFVMQQHCALHRPPPCDPNAVYPDPCAYGITETISDAGRDAR